jgi:hypothetical protein
MGEIGVMPLKSYSLEELDTPIVRDGLRLLTSPTLEASSGHVGLLQHTGERSHSPGVGNRVVS